MDRYEPSVIEPEWQRRWAEADLHRTPEDGSRPKFYCLDFFPYPSGEGLSVGHCHNYVPTDVVARFMRMRGHNVLHPMGWDAFGLPAENRAIEEGIHPRVTVRQNTDNYRRQLRLVGTSYDWSREIDSSSPDFYRWTQWFFLLLYKRGLAYRATGDQWWCPACQTILANEEIHAGLCWRCGTEVTKKSLVQWYFRITAYADRLLDDLVLVDWPESTVAMQRNWIGRSVGADIRFPTERDVEIQVFTTRPDTLPGATFMVLAPEHPLVERLVGSERRDDVRVYLERARRMSEVERIAADRERTGVFLGTSCRNPLTGEPLPIWIADYAVPGYGTGAVMGVPAHDQRDLEFARRFDLPVRVVVAPPGWDGGAPDAALLGPGTMANSGPYDGLSSGEAKGRIVADLARLGRGGPKTTYRMRDWLISRQRYWGVPIPIVYCDRCGEVPVPEEHLPVLLPDVPNYRPTGSGRSPLAAVEDFVRTACPSCDGEAIRETDTMAGFACSSWYFLRFADPRNERAPFSPEQVRYWLPVDLYVGGAEHATMHLLYARFWTKVMHDAGLVDFVEPFAKLRHQGVITAPDGRRMSKSRRNVITPDEVVASHGADALRAYELFLGPFEQTFAWNVRGIEGVARWLHRVWRLVLGQLAPAAPATFSAEKEAAGPRRGGAAAHLRGGALPQGQGPLSAKRSRSSVEDERRLARLVHRTIREVTEDLEGLRFNTMVAALMECVNELHRAYSPERARTAPWEEAIDTLLLLLAPTAPHLSEELWARRGRPYSIHQQPWPRYDAAIARDDVVRIVLQVDGRTRDRIDVAAGRSQDELRDVALGAAGVRAAVAGAGIVKVVVVPDKLVNVVTVRR